MSEMYEPTVYKVCLGCGAWGDVKCSCKQRSLPEQPDLATRVAADIFVRSTDGWFDGSSAIDDRSLIRVSEDAIRAGRIFAEAVAKEGK